MAALSAFTFASSGWPVVGSKIAPAPFIFSSMIGPATVAGTTAIPAFFSLAAMVLANSARTGSGSSRSLGRRTGATATVFSAG